jgi:L-ascorbate metabolism protein UlaG (beta-lactamase superfamily)
MPHGSRTLLVHGSANYEPEALKGRHADVVYLGVGGIRRESDAFVSAYWNEVVRRTAAKRVFLVHWDNFFRGLDRQLEPMRSPRDSFPEARDRIQRLADADNVDVRIPEAWTPIDPFEGLTLP